MWLLIGAAAGKSRIKVCFGVNSCLGGAGVVIWPAEPQHTNGPSVYPHWDFWANSTASGLKYANALLITGQESIGMHDAFSPFGVTHDVPLSKMWLFNTLNLH